MLKNKLLQATSSGALEYPELLCKYRNTPQCVSSLCVHCGQSNVSGVNIPCVNSRVSETRPSPILEYKTTVLNRCIRKLTVDGISHRLELLKHVTQVRIPVSTFSLTLLNYWNTSPRFESRYRQLSHYLQLRALLWYSSKNSAPCLQIDQHVFPTRLHRAKRQLLRNKRSAAGVGLRESNANFFQNTRIFFFQL